MLLEILVYALGTVLIVALGRLTDAALGQPAVTRWWTEPDGSTTPRRPGPGTDLTRRGSP
ncbi:hypothetical protein [Jiangella gansuensis]|uniref:hypothetical protein n=1 Tax=Jiangella gansuensis TaxID=281473 RepID=UPI00047A15AE|nr:hypothetical protein [Jiangella gansuensis]